MSSYQNCKNIYPAYISKRFQGEVQITLNLNKYFSRNGEKGQ